MANSSPEVIYYSRFKPTYAAGGGARRLLQLLELMSDLDLGLVSSGYLNRGQILRSYLPGLHDQIRKRIFLKKWDDSHRAYVNNLWNSARVWAADKAKAVDSRLAVLDDPIYFLPLYKNLKRSRFSLVAICHNIESLSTAQVSPGSQKSLFLKEIEVLGGCDLVITISREETFLLRNLGINAYYLPYYPPTAIQERLLTVREARKQAQKDHYLLLGTAKNSATRQGMQAFIEAWNHERLASVYGPLLVAGYGTERLDVSGTDDVKLLGPLADADLDALLSRVKGCICYQQQAAGALTRITEMLMAGVPVVANSHAARSYYNMPGVVVFEEMADLGEALTSAETLYASEIPPVPVKPHVPSLSRFLKR